MKGAKRIQRKMPIDVKTMEDWIVKKMQTSQMMILVRNRVLSGFLPKPRLAIIKPPRMKPRLKNPQRKPQVWTETRERP